MSLNLPKVTMCPGRAAVVDGVLSCGPHETGSTQFMRVPTAWKTEAQFVPCMFCGAVFIREVPREPA